ncbi:hypothetical protein Y1Q_0002298 [Alligator mississippiensis]|uniref:Uncharacterized protein n=1 Tax=Alligator mississippiensis TaxID=8496 RepID=A0A151MGM9_ALLMI|nr:hypothetical protein Y1Q_0002298 [Alligator mississippiensis]
MPAPPPSPPRPTLLLPPGGARLRQPLRQLPSGIAGPSAGTRAHVQPGTAAAGIRHNTDLIAPEIMKKVCQQS